MKHFWKNATGFGVVERRLQAQNKGSRKQPRHAHDERGRADVAGL